MDMFVGMQAINLLSHCRPFVSPFLGLMPACNRSIKTAPGQLAISSLSLFT